MIGLSGFRLGLIGFLDRDLYNNSCFFFLMAFLVIDYFGPFCQGLFGIILFFLVS